MLRLFVAVILLSLVAVGAQAALLGRAALTPGGTNYQAYYDDVLNITWLAEANLADTNSFGVAGIWANGTMTWPMAHAWIAAMNTDNSGAGYLGRNDWRLPAFTDTGAPGCVQFSFMGTDCGMNVDLATGELAHLFYSTLGNAAETNASGIHVGCSGPAPFYCLTNDGPFYNLQPHQYWYGAAHATDTILAWEFDFLRGGQNPDNKTGSYYYAWAVRPGDIANVVPISPAVWLFGSALGVWCNAEEDVQLTPINRLHQGNHCMAGFSFLLALD